MIIDVFCVPPMQIGFPAALFWEYLLPNHPNITEQVREKT
jgi:hypothetical protein